LRIIARAMAMRCFCPPESLTPRSPTWVLSTAGGGKQPFWAVKRPYKSTTQNRCTVENAKAAETPRPRTVREGLDELPRVGLLADCEDRSFVGHR
jgi:hypothetical protein